MKSRGELAKELFESGYNCSQAVILAFHDKLDLDRETILKISSSFGGGMGRLREVCGTVSSMFIIAGLKFGYTEPEDREGKIKHYALIQKLAEEFKNINGSIVCKELLNVKGPQSPVREERSKEYYRKRPCSNLVKCSAEIIENNLFSDS